ncbi:HNH endonuclease family protein [Psychrobacter sp. bablab_jr012]|uniref:HNH endonuclease family protein n=1 Tax=Psychrobacter sp. bablab_jr012 TaxID=2755061 RepID=UPI001D18B52D|nr:HNH endonuclease family protein [Psychrobacter sp. bablab_jr012]
MLLILGFDDKQLLTQFETYILAPSVSKMSQNVVTEDKITPLSQVKTFIYALLKSKFIFDHFIIKRNMQDNKGQWTLNKLTKGEDKKNSYYKNSFENDNNDLVMLQSAFHVSTPTTNYKHWLNAVLYYAYQHYQYNDIGLDSTAYLSHIEAIARAFMLRRYLTDEPDDYHHIIYQTPDFNQISFTNTDASLTPNHLRTQIKQYLRYNNIRNIFVFNYLDYLLWKDEERPEFTFTARSSIEHFYPQNKRDDKLFINDKNVEDTLLHSFGNLCLISHSLNSRVSNDMPDVKVKYFLESKQIDSLKLSRMIKCISGQEATWDKTMIAQHEEQMLEIMMKGLNLMSEGA